MSFFRSVTHRSSLRTRPGRQTRTAIILALIVNLSAWLPRQAEVLLAAPQVQQMDGLPLSFEPNVGQAPAQVRFLAHFGDATMFFTRNDLTIMRPASSLHAGAALNAQTGHIGAEPPAPQPGIQVWQAGSQWDVIRVRLPHDNPHLRIEAQGRLPGVVSYFIGADPRRWQTAIPTFARLVYHDILPGIDLWLDGRQDRLRLGYALSHQARPARSQPHIMDTGGGPVLIRDREPFSVPAALNQSTTGPVWQLPGPQHADPTSVALTIALADRPQQPGVGVGLRYASYLGGTGDDRGTGIAIDGQGNAYVTGRSISTDFPTTPGMFQGRRGYADAFVAKINPAGTALLYATYLGGSNFDVGAGIAVDTKGDAYVTGSTSSHDFPTTRGAVSMAGNPAWTAFVAKLNPLGTHLLYAARPPGITSKAIALDNTGSAYITGPVDPSNVPAIAGPVHPQGSASGAFVAKLDPQGATLRYWTYVEGAGVGIAVDGQGDAYVVGNASSGLRSTPGAPQSQFSGGISDAFVSSLDPTGHKIRYATYLGGRGWNEGIGIAVDRMGNAYVIGNTTSGTFPVTAGVLQPRYAGGVPYFGDIFVASLNRSGARLRYATYLGGRGADRGTGIAVDAKGRAYVTGETLSRDLPTTRGAVQSTPPGSTNIYVACLSANGATLDYFTYLGGSREDDGGGIALNAQGDIYITGRTNSRDFPTTPNAVQGQYPGGQAGDSIVARIAIPQDVQNS